MRAILDTNVLISRYLSPSGVPAQIYYHWEHRDFELVVSEAILAEYHRVLSSNRLARCHQLSATDIGRIIDGIRGQAIIVEQMDRL